MQYEDDYERRRAYVARRRKQRKRQRMVHIFIFFILVGILLFSGVFGFLFWKRRRGSTETPTVSSSEPPSSGQEALPTETKEAEPERDDRSDDIDKLLSQAEALAKTYDYDSAIRLLSESAEYSGEQAVLDAVSSYEETKAGLIRANITEIPHVFFHSIIMDNKKAFDGDADEKGYNQVMTTKSEFLHILEQMYERGYVLVRIHDMAQEITDENGKPRMVAGDIMLPPGKKPFVMSQDDVCYYDYMKGDGFASRIIVGEDGKPTCEMVMDDGTVSVGSYDLIPLLEDFIQEHPDFSYKGARAVIAFTGYQGVLGYRTDPSYAESNPNYEKDKESVRQVAQCLRDNGWELASHSWGHIYYGTRSASDVITDARKWEDRVETLIGDTDIILYPFGSDIGDWHPYSHENEKYEALYQMGFRYFCNVDSSRYWVQLGSDYLRQGRRNLDGYRMYYDLPETNPSKTYLNDLFDVSSVFDRERPVPVPPMQ